jgi:hypothetical protein
MGSSVGVSPVMVILAILAFGSLLGITGAFLAIPLAAILQVLMDHLVTHAGLSSTEVPDESAPNIMATMRAQIRRLRAEGLERLRAGRGRINLTRWDNDDLDAQVDHLLSKADQALTEAAQSAGTDTARVHTAHLAKIDQAIYQAGAMVEEAEAQAAAELESKDAHLTEAELAIDHASAMVEEAKAKAVTGQKIENALLVEADLAIEQPGVKVEEAKDEGLSRRKSERAHLAEAKLDIDHAGKKVEEAKTEGITKSQPRNTP